MIVIIILVIFMGIGLGIAIYEDSFVYFSLFTLFGAFFGMMFGTMVSDIKPAECMYQYEDKIELIAINESLGYDKEAYIIPTHIDNEYHFMYVYKEKMGANVIGYINADNAHIRYEDEEISPYIQKWTRKRADKVARFFFPYKEVGYTIHLPQSANPAG